MIQIAQDNDMTVTQFLFSQIREAEVQADKDSKKQMLRAMFARHHRSVAKVNRSKGEQGKAQCNEYKARRLEACIADYANDLIY